MFFFGIRFDPPRAGIIATAAFAIIDSFPFVRFEYIAWDDLD
jgi:hypothetical protein